MTIYSKLVSLIKINLIIIKPLCSILSCSEKYIIQVDFTVCPNSFALTSAVQSWLRQRYITSKFHLVNYIIHMRVHTIQSRNCTVGKRCRTQAKYNFLGERVYSTTFDYPVWHVLSLRLTAGWQVKCVICQEEKKKTTTTVSLKNIFFNKKKKIINLNILHYFHTEQQQQQKLQSAYNGSSWVFIKWLRHKGYSSGFHSSAVRGASQHSRGLSSNLCICNFRTATQQLHELPFFFTFIITAFLSLVQ